MSRDISDSDYRAAVDRLAAKTEFDFYSEKSEQAKSDRTTASNSAGFVKRQIATALRLAKKIPSRGVKYLNNKRRTYQINRTGIDLGVNKPRVSIIIPVFNKANLTRQCLNSLAAHVSQYSFEVVLVDNASSEPIDALAKKYANVVYVRNEENLGYVGGCNVGAQKASGEMLVFLNNDTVVMSGWLDSLIARLDQPGVGIAGSKLLYPDGRLQEAGGIIFNDSSGYNFGKGQDTGDFTYNYAFDVDYVSGASLAISRKLFNKMGGFDKLYQPAYYEDTDLCFKVHQAGLKVIYEPHSLVVHVEGATAGTDLSSGFKKYQAINQVKFTKRWQSVLKQHQPPTDNLFLARTHRYKKRVLFIDNSIPSPDKDSGSVREWAILEILKDLGFFVTFWPANLVASMPYTQQLQADGIEVVYGDLDFKSVLHERHNSYSHVILARPYVGTRFIDDIMATQPDAKLIFDTVDLHFLRLQRQAEIEKSQARQQESKDWQTVECWLINHVDQTWVVSSIEKQLLAKMGYKNVEIISNIHTIAPLQHKPPFSRRRDLLFIGNFGHPPNVDGILWFTNDILPLVRQQIPDINLIIVGSNATAEISELDKLPNIQVKGYVHDVDSLFDEARVFVSPLRYGAGVKGKIGQSISLGLPLVTTSIGAEGMNLTNQKDCFIADDAKAFAAAVIKLYQDQSTWHRFQVNAQAVIQRDMSVASTKQKLEKIL